MAIDIVKSILNDLSIKFEEGNFEDAKYDLVKIKLEILNFPHLEEYNNIAISALEFGVLFSAADHDLDSFARNMAQLKPYYSLSASKSSNRKTYILGLNLMYLLVENDLSEFHSYLELLSDSEMLTPYLSFPITLERQMMVGLYDKIFTARFNMPHLLYEVFMDNLLQTVRDSIADCIESSYKSIKVTVVIKMMKFDCQNDLMEYVSEFRENWFLESNDFFFHTANTCLMSSDIPSMSLIGQTLSYATELVRIV